jgi:hypothetical protein
MIQLFGKVVLVCFVLVILVIVIAFSRTDVIPTRPDSIAPGAVFLWSPTHWLPGGIRGVWLAYWQDSTRADRCRFSSREGASLFEDQYIPYGQTDPVPAGELKIDPELSRRCPLYVGDGDTFATLVFLKGGQVLIPASAYERGVADIEMNGLAHQRHTR